MNPAENTGIFRRKMRVCRRRFMGMHGLHTVDKSQNRNNSRPETVDNSVDGVDRYASIHPFEGGMNMQKMDQAAKAQLAACFAGETT